MSTEIHLIKGKERKWIFSLHSDKNPVMIYKPEVYSMRLNAFSVEQL